MAFSNLACLQRNLTFMARKIVFLQVLLQIRRNYQHGRLFLFLPFIQSFLQSSTEEKSLGVGQGELSEITHPFQEIPGNDTPTRYIVKCFQACAKRSLG